MPMRARFPAHTGASHALFIAGAAPAAIDVLHDGGYLDAAGEMSRLPRFVSSAPPK